jgi:hypothetical protein
MLVGENKLQTTHFLVFNRPVRSSSTKAAALFKLAGAVFLGRVVVVRTEVAWPWPLLIDGLSLERVLGGIVNSRGTGNL